MKTMASLCVLLCVGTVTACSNANTNYLVSEPGLATPERPAIVDPTSPPLAGHVPRAQPPVSDVYGTLSSAQSMGPDNRSLVARTGLNSDPSNPSGLAGRPANWNSL